MSASTDSLSNLSVCIDRCTPQGMKLAVLIVLAAQIAGVSTDPGVLQQNARCYLQCIPPRMKLSVLVSLAQQIAGI